MKKSIVWVSSIAALPLMGLSGITNPTNIKLDINKKEDELELKVESQINNIKIWRMEKDNKGNKSKDPYYGVILPIGTAVENEKIKKLVKNKGNVEISFDKKYDKDKSGIYTANISIGDKKTKLKIFLTDESFNFKSFEEVTLPRNFSIPENIKRIGRETFMESKLNQKFYIPNNVIDIGWDAFNFAILNDEFKLPTKIKKIQYSIFWGATLNKNFKIPSNITRIGESAFWGAKLNDSFEIPPSVTSIGRTAFVYADLNKNFTIPKSVKTLGEEVLFKTTYLGVKNNTGHEDYSNEAILEEYKNKKEKLDKKIEDFKNKIKNLKIKNQPIKGTIVPNKKREELKKTIETSKQEIEKAETSADIEKEFKKVENAYNNFDKFINLANKATNDISITKLKIEKELNNTYSNLDKKEKIFPSSFSGKTKPKEFGFQVPEGIPKDVNVNYSFKEADDKKGEIIVKANISENNGERKSVDFILKGFNKKENSTKHSKSLSTTWIVIISVFSAFSLAFACFVLKFYKNKTKFYKNKKGDNNA